MNHTLIADSSREQFIPTLVANNLKALMIYENAVYHLMDRFTKDYKGGHWEFVEFENGAKAMIFDHSEVVHCENLDNYFDGEMSLRSLSLACNLMACSHMSFSTSGKTQDNLAENYHLLRDVLCEHPWFKDEAGKIFGLID